MTTDPGDARPEPAGAPAAEQLQGLAETMAELARDLEAEPSLDSTLQEIVDAAVRSIPGAQSASFCMVHERRTVETAAATSEVARACEQLQVDVGEGPCLDAVWEHEVVAVPDMRAATGQWPRFAPRAVELGVGSMLCFRLFVSGDQLGALDLYSTERGAFGGGDVQQLGRLFATHAAIAVASAQKLEQLGTGMQTRDVIGVAKGMLLERHGISEASAFRLLVRASQNTHRKVHDIAQHVVDTGALPRS